MENNTCHDAQRGTIVGLRDANVAPSAPLELLLLL
jgi:hypothetical protein